MGDSAKRGKRNSLLSMASREDSKTMSLGGCSSVPTQSECTAKSDAATSGSVVVDGVEGLWQYDDVWWSIFSSIEAHGLHGGTRRQAARRRRWGRGAVVVCCLSAGFSVQMQSTWSLSCSTWKASSTPDWVDYRGQVRLGSRTWMAV